MVLPGPNEQPVRRGESAAAPYVCTVCGAPHQERDGLCFWCFNRTVAVSEVEDNWPETTRAWRRLKASWRGLWAQVFLGWAIRCDEQAVIDFLWDTIETEIEARKRGPTAGTAGRPTEPREAA